MKQKHIIISLLCLLLAGGNGAYAQGVSKWKYLPKALAKQPKIPAVINPALKPSVQARLARLDLDFEVNFARAKAQWAAQPPAACTALGSCPTQFAGFVTWLDQLPAKRIVANNTTQQALQAVRQAILAYPTLNTQEQAQVNWLVIMLSKFRTGKLGSLENGDFYKIIYHPTPQEKTLPTAENFHFLLERRGVFKHFHRVKRVLAQTVRSFGFATDYEDTTKIIGLTFYQGFQPAKTRQELERVLDGLTPPGYTVRLSAHELGISATSRSKFRQGFLHLHFEKINAQQGEIPTDINIELWLGTAPYAGVIDPATRKIIAPFSDKQIAKNYLALFEKYLSENAKKTLLYLAR